MVENLHKLAVDVVENVHKRTVDVVEDLHNVHIPAVAVIDNLHIPALAAVDEAEGRHSRPGAGYKSALCHVALALAEVDKHIQVAAAAADTSLPTYVKAQFVFFQSKFNSFLSSDVIFLDEKLSENGWNA